MNCLQCGIETVNPKFCCKGHAVTYNNKTSPKRKPEGKCFACGLPCSASRKRCPSCISKRSWKKSIGVETLGSMRGKGNANRGGRYPYIRVHSRNTYIESGQPMSCKVCGYNYHVDVCHIKDLRDYPEDTLISEVNHISNLVALCKNHHWEFDTGHLELD